jgi:hypothetical protein
MQGEQLGFEVLDAIAPFLEFLNAPLRTKREQTQK